MDSEPTPQRKGLKRLQDLLTGNIFTKDFFKRQWLLLLLIALLCFITIGNGFKTNNQKRQIKALQTQVKEARYELLDVSATYTQKTQPSVIATQLQNNGSQVKESSHPAILIQ